MAIFPGAIATDSDLYIAVNILSTLLTDNPLTIGATTVNVVSTTGFPTVGFISIDAEIIKYTGKTATSFTGCTRGADGTSAASHLVNAQVDHNVIAAHHNVLKDELFAIETHLGVNGANVVHIAGVETLTGQKTFSAALLHADGTAALPGLAFASDTNTGFYLVAADRIGVSTNGSVKWTFNSTGTLESAFALLAGDGSASLPGLSFSNDPDTGVFRSGTNELAFATNGARRWRILSTGDLAIEGGSPTSVQLLAGAGVAGTPSYSFNVAGASTSGMFTSATNTLNWATNGVARMSLDTTSLTINLPVYHAFGTLTAPGMAFSGGANVGFAGSASTISATVPTGGDFEIRINSNQIVDFQAGNIFLGTQAQATKIRLGYAGATATPALTWDADPDTGFNNAGSGVIDVVGNGSSLFDFNPTVNRSKVLFQINATGMWNVNGTSGAPAYSFSSQTATGLYYSGSVTGEAIWVSNGNNSIRCHPTNIALYTGNVERWNVNSAGNFIPVTDNAFSLGQSGLRTSSVWSANGTIQTSMSTTKENVQEIWPEEPIECKVPMPVIFNRPGEEIDQRRLGWLADSLPAEAHPVIGRDEEGNPIRSEEDVYTDSILAMHSLALRNDYERLAAYQARIETLEAKVAALEAAE